MSESPDVDAMTRNVASPEGWRFGEDGVGSSQMFAVDERVLIDHADTGARH